MCFYALKILVKPCHMCNSAALVNYSNPYWCWSRNIAAYPAVCVWGFFAKGCCFTLSNAGFDNSRWNPGFDDNWAKREKMKFKLVAAAVASITKKLQVHFLAQCDLLWQAGSSPPEILQVSHTPETDVRSFSQQSFTTEACLPWQYPTSTSRTCCAHRILNNHAVHSYRTRALSPCHVSILSGIVHHRAFSHTVQSRDTSVRMRPKTVPSVACVGIIWAIV